MIKQISQNIWQLHFRAFGSCVYLLKIKEKNILIDTSSQEAREELLEDLEKLKVTPEQIDVVLLTHNHYDHNENLDLFSNAKVYSDKNVDELTKDFPEFKIIKTPGHTKDDICFLYKDVLFSGDTIFTKDHNYIGRTDFPESQPEKMQDSLNKLKKIKYKFLCPGHLI